MTSAAWISQFTSRHVMSWELSYTESAASGHGPSTQNLSWCLSELEYLSSMVELGLLVRSLVFCWVRSGSGLMIYMIWSPRSEDNTKF